MKALKESIGMGFGLAVGMGCFYFLYTLVRWAMFMIEKGM